MRTSVAHASIFNACPIYSASRRTDLRSERSHKDEGTSPMKRRLGRTVAAIFTAAVASAAIASPASAGILTVSATDCADAGLTQPFKRWSDSDYYKLVKSGSFEGGATGWQLNGGASVVSGNESF